MQHASLTCFGGYLRRHPDGAWAWANGEPEPAMHDTSSSLAGLVTRDGEDGRFVEVLIALAEAFDPLRWVLLRVDRGDYRVDVTSGVYVALGSARADGGARSARSGGASVGAGIMVVLVPERDWQAWCESFPIVPMCSSLDTVRLQQKAITLGWALPGVGDASIYPS